MRRLLTPAFLLSFGILLNAQTAPIYDSTPAPLPPSLISQSFQAQRISEFGNLVSFGGPSPHHRPLTTVTIDMVTLAYQTKYNLAGSGWTHDITLNIYSVNNSGPIPTPGGLIQSVTQSFFIPWRPEPDPTCGGTLWKASDGCHNGMALPITFDLSSLSLVLPSQVIFGIAYNTQSAGSVPIGADGPYNDLNVGLNASGATVGTNLSAPSAYLNGTIAQSYADNGAGGVGVFRLDVGGTHTTIAIQFNVPDPPVFLTVTGGGTQSASVGAPFGSALQAQVTNEDHSPLAGVPVTFSVVSISGASATLSAASVTTDSNGLASVTATANAIAGAYVVTADVTSVTPPLAATFDLTNLAGPAQTIAFVQQPSDTLAGQVVTPIVTVILKDAGNNPIVGTTVALSLPGGVQVFGSLATTDTTGAATFLNLVIQTAGAYQLQATAAGGPTTISGPFVIRARTDSVTISVYDGDGQSAPTGSTYAEPLQVLVTDLYNNVLVSQPVIFNAPSSGPSVTFSGSAAVTASTDRTGIATSPAMVANAQAGTFQVMASTSGAPSAALFSLANIAGATNRLSFIQQPTDTIAGQVITPPVTVQLQDSSGNAVQMAGVPVTVQSNSVLQRKGLFSGNPVQNTDANGLATFADLSIGQAGTFQLLASSPGLASAQSLPFHVTSGPASLIIASGGVMQSTVVSTPFPSPLQATVTDAAGNPVSGVPVMFTAPASGPSATFGGQLTVSVSTDAQGHAVAIVSANNIAGSYFVTATAAMVTGSASFLLTNVTLVSEPPPSLLFVQQPTNATAGQVIAPPVKVQIQNGAGGASNIAGVPIVLSLSSSTGALLGTVVQPTDDTGTSTFNDLRVNAVGMKQLVANSQNYAPSQSAAFQISAGAPATITPISGTPQATTVSTAFPLLLQARVQDIADNPVGGASVTFTVPGSGPSGAFSGTATVTTDSNGVAAAPVLTANNTAGNFGATASVAGGGVPATFALTNLPQSGSLVVGPTQLSFSNQINQSPAPGQTVQVASTAAALSWSASPSAPWIIVSPSSGNTPGTATISVNPPGLPAGNYSGSVVFTSPASGGATAVLVTYTIGAKPAFVITPPTLVFTTSSTTITPPAQTVRATSSAGPISYGVTTQVATPTGGNWLKVSSSSAQTPGGVQVSVDITGLNKGIFNGSVLFTPSDSSINSVAVPVTLLVACGQGGCTGLPATIQSVVNSASFHPGGAPRAAMTIFGANLADGVYQATAFPLPTQLGPTSVTVNGGVVPLYYVSPTQINFQMPSSAPPTSVQVGVSNGFSGLRIAQAQTTVLTAVQPGLYTAAGNRAAALNQDLSVHTPATPVPAGSYIILYMTGGGPISPPLPDGTAAPASPLSVLTGNVQVTIGGKSAQVTYAGAAPGFAGLSQLNVIVPAGLAAGDQAVFVSVNGVPSNASLITVK
jgi:adhesin/invasin